MMTPEMLVKLKHSLIAHEGYEKFPYIDSVGKMTIGIGYNISDRGMTDEWINTQYLEDVTYFYSKWNEFPWFAKLNEARQIVLIDFSFMGWQKVLEFKGLFKALALDDYEQASKEMLHSEWADQVKNRSTQLAQGMLSGEYNV